MDRRLVRCVVLILIAVGSVSALTPPAVAVGTTVYYATDQHDGAVVFALAREAGVTAIVSFADAGWSWGSHPVVSFLVDPAGGATPMPSGFEGAPFASLSFEGEGVIYARTGDVRVQNPTLLESPHGNHTNALAGGAHINASSAWLVIMWANQSSGIELRIWVPSDTTYALVSSAGDGDAQGFTTSDFSGPLNAGARAVGHVVVDSRLGWAPPAEKQLVGYVTAWKDNIAGTGTLTLRSADQERTMDLSADDQWVTAGGCICWSNRHGLFVDRAGVDSSLNYVGVGPAVAGLEVAGVVAAIPPVAGLDLVGIQTFDS